MAMLKDRHEVEICGDCLYFNEYGTLGREATVEENKQHSQNMDACLLRYDLDDGDYIELIQSCDESGESLEPHFSWASCDTCNQHLGGNRYDAYLLILNDKQEEV